MTADVQLLGSEAVGDVDANVVRGALESPIRAARSHPQSQVQ